MPWLLLALVVAQTPLDSDPAFQEGMRLYEDFEYEKAVFRFKEAARREGLSPTDRAAVLVRLGMTYADLRDDENAKEAFSEALTLDPLIVLPQEASPKIKALLDEARRELRAARATPRA